MNIWIVFMQKSVLTLRNIKMYLLICLSTPALAHVVDIHLPSSEELYEIFTEKKETERKCEEAENTFNDPEAPREERIKALEVLLDNGRMV